MKFKRYITEKIELTGEKQKDKWLKETEKWKADLRKMTKIYKSLKAESTPQAIKAFEQARKLFNTFRDNWERWHTQFTKKTFVADKGNVETIYQQEVRVKGWRAEMEISSLFPTTYDYNTKTDVPAPWQLDSARYRRGDTRKNKIIVYQKAFKKAFDAIEELIRYEFDVIKPDTKEQLNVAGVNLIITQDTATGNFSKKNLKMFIEILPQAIKAIKKSGFTDTLKGLTVKLRLTDRKTGDVGGEYITHNDTIAIYKWGIADKPSALRTLVHELGHRYYRRALNQKARDAWDNAIWKSFITVEKEHVNEFFNKYIKPNFTPNDEGKYSTDKKDRNRLNSVIKKNESDPNRKAIFLYLLHADTFSITLDSLMDLVGERIHIEFISDYAKKNTEEAFCEAFALWVNNRNQLGEWTRDFFKEIVRTGGANLKENKLIEKYLVEKKGVTHWKKSKWSEFSACDKRNAENLRLSNCKHTDDYTEITCKKCKKEVMSVKRNGGWVHASDFKYI
jgi:hypothetical protein